MNLQVDPIIITVHASDARALMLTFRDDGFVEPEPEHRKPLKA